MNKFNHTNRLSTGTNVLVFISVHLQLVWSYLIGQSPPSLLVPRYLLVLFYVITIPILSEPPELTGEEGEDMDSDIPKIYEKVIYYILVYHVGLDKCQVSQKSN